MTGQRGTTGGCHARNDPALRGLRRPPLSAARRPGGSGCECERSPQPAALGARGRLDDLLHLLSVWNRDLHQASVKRRGQPMIDCEGNAGFHDYLVVHSDLEALPKAQWLRLV